ncbi:outer membrane protein transport protein [Hymenobacter lucidus]|uniref:Outer membrane protein transport protein n=1 Tax=Hymenobacter lucidus TaxID=2880930 RepID=A0ABS8AX71_9BACT|nr:outer membrane protein transport protein [Hymenobacter lucidus]MCB2410405.1 outer membrane protein transport protein [Hymenobacter lucidus]
MLKTKSAGFVGLVVLGLMAAPNVHGQGLGNSPYSRLGLGDYTPNLGGVRQQGMGGIGLAAPNSSNVNDINPALLYYTGRTTYEAGFNGQYKTLRNATTSNKTGSGTLGYLALSFPISKYWAAAAGLKPFSSVDYESNTVEKVANDPNLAQVVKQQKGEGEITEAYMSHAVRVAKGLTLGVTASYIFGTIDESIGSAVVPAINDPNTTEDDPTQSAVVDHVHYSDFAFRAGLHYRGKASEKLNYNLAGVYSFQTKLGGTRSSSLRREDVSGLLLEELALASDEKGSATLPALTQLGVSFDNNKNWSASLDVAQQQWSKFKGFAGPGANIALNNTMRIGVGGEYTPDATSVDNYFKRVSYRAGLSVSQMPYRPSGQTLYDRAVSWGFAFPMPSATPLEATIISLAFTYGQRGNTDANTLTEGGTTRVISNVKEDYVRMQLGVTLNNRWFIKRRIE